MFLCYDFTTRVEGDGDRKAASCRLSAGQSGLGKSTLVNTLFKSKVSRKSCTPSYEEKISKTVHLQSISHSESHLSFSHTHNFMV